MAGGMEWMTHSVEESADSLSTGRIGYRGTGRRELFRPREGRGICARGFGSSSARRGNRNLSSDAPGGETNLAVDAPLLPEQQMKPMPEEAAGVEQEPFQPVTWDMWRWLVLLAMVALWLEWWLYYSSRERQRNAEIRETSGSERTAKIGNGTAGARGNRNSQSKCAFGDFVSMIFCREFRMETDGTLTP